MQLPGIARVVVGDASICEANLSGRDALELVPRQPGMISMLVWINGLDAAHRRQLLIIVESGGVARTVDEFDSVLTEPIDGRLVLITGEHAIIPAAGVTQCAMKDSAVAQPRGGHLGELIIEARAEGATWLLLWNGTRRAKKHFVVVHSRSWVEAEPDDGVRNPVPVLSTPEVELQNR